MLAKTLGAVWIQWHPAQWTYRVIMTTDFFLSATEASQIVSTNKVVLREISLIQEKILDAIRNCNTSSANYCMSGTYCIIIAGDTPMTYDGAIASATVTNPGESYFPIEAVVTIITTGLGTGATASLTIDNFGTVTEVIITSGGSDYVQGETNIAVMHPTGQGFVGTVNIVAGEVHSVSIISGGLGYYTLLPSIELTDTGNGTDALLTPNIDALTGSITSVTVTEPGHNYAFTTTASVLPPETSSGTGASIAVTVRPLPLAGVDPYNYYLYLNDQDTTCPVEKDIQSVITYFRKKGYTIEPQINPATNSTIQWNICWC